MIDGGLALFLIGVLLACAVPAERAVAQRRWHRVELTVRPPVALSFPIAPPSAPVDHIARDAEDALDEDDLARAVRRIGAVYDGSADD